MLRCCLDYAGKADVLADRNLSPTTRQGTPPMVGLTHEIDATAAKILPVDGCMGNRPW